MKLNTDKIIAEVENGIGWLTFNQPEKRNAMSLEMWQGTSDALDAFAADPDVRVVVMKGAGDRAFVSGADISQFEKSRSNAEVAEEYARISGGARERLANIEKPLIAMIRGFCIGGGLAVAMAADFRISTDEAEFGIPAARMGLVYPADAIKALVDLVGPGHARKILYTGRRMKAEEALRIGLIEEVTTPEKLDEVVRETATLIANNAPLSIRGSKKIIGQYLGRDRDLDFAAMEQLSNEALDSNDYREGRTAFMEKRNPTFTGT
ncbi:enoyl-CoA hydratase [Oceanicola sp. 22II-s10i]|uniref:enoyl-CoA hydratase n=1 Tax=Oceanicola sp. 22II-s10i TaxID=1317116 RepID=UPI000B524D00|nr:enoyl-CoA hydratase [Oceanicola sp. 22II-s10i]OWU85940.1 enoyl-CoA hydratase [Oceanicola sp. 22II-s10i]